MLYTSASSRWASDAAVKQSVAFWAENTETIPLVLGREVSTVRRGSCVCQSRGLLVFVLSCCCDVVGKGESALGFCLLIIAMQRHTG